MRLVRFLVFLVLLSCSGPKEKIASQSMALIPKPQEITVSEGAFSWNAQLSFHSDETFGIAKNFMVDYLSKSGYSLVDASLEGAKFKIIRDSLIPSEGYSLSVTKKSIVLKAADASGAFYGIQTLRQLMPTDLEHSNSFPNPAMELPLVQISDYPKFSYRGMHLDVGRHFFDKECIKRYLSYLALLKMNYFHWHLTEDQGWRIEIKKYPKLIAHSAYRDETLVGHYNNSPAQYDGQRYGGFYTQEDIKEIVEYAQKLNITIIPEIEMPGHAQAAISAYPELGCTGDLVPVAKTWGVFEEIYCPKESTFQFLEDVLSEVIALFPGEYIHIGGDEAPKNHWKNCSHCQDLIRNEGLKDEHELQSYFIKRIETFLNSKGKKIIGWDEILEGGLAPNATVMSWRGAEGGIAAAKQQHSVIMTPTSYCYFDYYQSERPEEPLAIGGFLPLEKVFDFNPIPEELTASESKFILGAQGNLWTEYIPNEKQLEYMVFPRILAMSEVVWSGPTADFQNDYPQFANRTEKFFKRLDALGVNYANHLYEIQSTILKDRGKVWYQLSTMTEGKEIRYSHNNSESQVYTSPIPIGETTTVESQLYLNDKPIGFPLKDSVVFHKAVTGNISLNIQPHPSYGSGGKEALINGKLGSENRYGDSEWLGFWGEDLEIELTLDAPTEIHAVNLRFFHAPGQWIHAPQHFAVRVFLEDGKIVTNKFFLKVDPENPMVTLNGTLAAKEPIITKKIVLLIPNYGTIPEGQQGAGNKAWTFIDEIVVE